MPDVRKMKTDRENPSKDRYRQLRRLPWSRLWEEEVPAFDRADPLSRVSNVGLVRAVGVVFSESGDPSQVAAVTDWLVALLRDPQEKIRRYAMAALPKIGAGRDAEKEVLNLLRHTSLEREKKFLGRTLDKIGGAATLENIHTLGDASPQTAQKVRASLARESSLGVVELDHRVEDWSGLCIHLRGRRGLESFVKNEATRCLSTREKFRAYIGAPGLVVLEPLAPFTLADIFLLRSFGTLGIVIGTTGHAGGSPLLEEIAAAIACPRTQSLLGHLTRGQVRYRIDFVSKGHQRGAVRQIATRAYALCPQILNDPLHALWAVDIHPTGHSFSVELRPRLLPDPRFSYRRGDVPAASHPPLAACMALLAGSSGNDIVWDPFCGSGLELIERARLGGVERIYGSDRSAEALSITLSNLEAAQLSAKATLMGCDFREFAAKQGLQPGSLTQIITNPPMGRRVPIDNIKGLITDLFLTAAKLLRPGGRLVFANPLFLPCPDPRLSLQTSREVDFGGFTCRLESYIRIRDGSQAVVNEQAIRRAPWSASR